MYHLLKPDSMIIPERFKNGQNQIISVINSFDTIPLYKMSKVGLMNRIDTKYVFSLEILPALLNKLRAKYQVMEINQDRIFPYVTTYLDTKDFLFFIQHMTGKLERHKIRYRKYELSGVSYLEIKKKTNKLRTEKVRMVNRFDPVGFDDRASCFIAANTPYECDSLKPQITNTFTRTTLVNLDSNERITFDFDLTFSDQTGKIVKLPFISVAELKRESLTNKSSFVSVVKEFGIRPTGFSKYCIGSQLIREMPKRNLLKPKLMLINKLENEYNRSVGIR
ncbi:MAG: polyphosphate polymerase domain-containing protein [Bacteroidales bacterium]